MDWFEGHRKGHCISHTLPNEPAFVAEILPSDICFCGLDRHGLMS